MTARKILLALLLAIVAPLLVGCSGYQITSKAIGGDASYVLIVNKNDPRLKQPGISGVNVVLQTDPGKLNRKVVASNYTDGEGMAKLGVDEIGAGFLEYDVGVFARKKGFSPAEGMFRLPSSNKVFLIVLGRGQDRDLGYEREDLYEEADQFYR